MDKKKKKILMIASSIGGGLGGLGGLGLYLFKRKKKLDHKKELQQHFLEDDEAKER